MKKSMVFEIMIIKNKKSEDQVIWITRHSTKRHEITRFYFRKKNTKLGILLEKLSSSYRSVTNYYFGG